MSTAARTPAGRWRRCDDRYLTRDGDHILCAGHGGAVPTAATALVRRRTPALGDAPDALAVDGARTARSFTRLGRLAPRGETASAAERRHVVDQAVDRQRHQFAALFRGGLAGVGAHAAVGVAGAEVERLADRAGGGDLRRVVGRLDARPDRPTGSPRSRTAWRGCRGRSGTGGWPGRCTPVRSHQFFSLQAKPRLRPGVAGLGVELGEGRLDGGDVAAVAVQEIDLLEAVRGPGCGTSRRSPP